MFWGVFVAKRGLSVGLQALQLDFPGRTGRGLELSTAWSTSPVEMASSE